MSRYYTRDAVRAHFDQAIATRGGAAALAAKAGINKGHITDMKYERRNICPRTLAALGFDPAPFYRKSDV